MSLFKKSLVVLLVIALTMSLGAVSLAGQEMRESTSSVFVDGLEVATGERGNVALNISGSTFLSVRAMSVALNREVHWEPGTTNLYFGPRTAPQASYNLLVTTPMGSSNINFEQVLALDVTSFEAVDRGNTRSFAGVPLVSVLETMGVDVSEVYSFIFIAADGMSATAYAQEVLDSTNGFLVVKENDEIFTSRELGGNGPFMVVFADDGVPGRWVRNLMEIIVVTEPVAPIFHREINIIADGNIVNAVDVLGNPADPFMLGGVIYIPIRAVSETLGMAVAWNSAENAIFIGDIPAALSAYDEGEIIINAGGQSFVVTMTDIMDLGPVDFYATIRGERREYTGVPIADIMDFLNLDVSGVTNMITFDARDGHGTGGTPEEVFDPAKGFIVIAEDGVSLGHWAQGGRGPFMLVFAHDVFPQRFIRYLTAINILDENVLHRSDRGPQLAITFVGGNRQIVTMEDLLAIGPVEFVARERNFTGVAVIDVINHFGIDISGVYEGSVFGYDGFNRPFSPEELADNTGFFIVFKEDGEPLPEGFAPFISVFAHDEGNGRQTRNFVEIVLNVPDVVLDMNYLVGNLGDYEFVITRRADAFTVTMDDLAALGLVDFSARPRSGEDYRHFIGVAMDVVFNSLGIDMNDASMVVFRAADGFSASFTATEAMSNGFFVIGENGELLGYGERGRIGPFFAVSTGLTHTNWVRMLQSVTIN